MNIIEHIRDVTDFPQQGVIFKDISPLLKSPEALQFICNEIIKAVDLHKIDYFIGIESRGFILASMLAAHYDKGFIPLRKVGKLPPPVIAQDYTLEYGTATLEINPGVGRVMIVDDVLATGGTLQAAILLAEKAGYHIEQVAVLINLKFLNTMTFNGAEVFSLVHYS